MHIYDQDTNFQGGWALVSEQLPYAAGAARSILLDRHLDPETFKNDDRIAIVFIGEGGAQNGRMAECLNAAAKENGLAILKVYKDSLKADARAHIGGSVHHDCLHWCLPGVPDLWTFALLVKLRAIDDALRLVPRPLRGVVKRVILP